ncbi:MAG: hypothetical protein JWO62_1149 [Acidimicrobiaceae bacterium]|nr:hypothetical protein [Acidimicrobiaceae bacterium]
MSDPHMADLEFRATHNVADTVLHGGPLDGTISRSMGDRPHRGFIYAPHAGEHVVHVYSLEGEFVGTYGKGDTMPDYDEWTARRRLRS